MKPNPDRYRPVAQLPELLNRCEAAQSGVLGIEVFELVDGGVRPRLDLILDLSGRTSWQASIEDARRFVSGLEGEHLVAEVELLPPPGYREEFEAWFAELRAESERLKSPHYVDERLSARLRALWSGAAERGWIHDILIEWLGSDDSFHWHAALSMVSQERVPHGPAALRAAAEAADTDSKRDFAETFLKIADDLEQALTVPPAYRSEFDAWWKQQLAAATEEELLGSVERALAARIDTLAADAPERQWIEQLMVERVGGLEMLDARIAIAFAHRHRVAAAIPEIRRLVGWIADEEMDAAAPGFLAAADDIAEAVGWPGDAAARGPETSQGAPGAPAGVELHGLAAISVWAPRRLRPVRGPLDATTRRWIEHRHDLLAAQGRRTGDPQTAEQAIAQWIADGEPVEQDWIFEILTDWLASRDPWRWHAALNLLCQHGVRAAAPAMRAAVSPPNTDDKTRWAGAFHQAADELDARFSQPAKAAARWRRYRRRGAG